jgi:hypothetical protein
MEGEVKDSTKPRYKTQNEQRNVKEQKPKLKSENESERLNSTDEK